MINVSQLMKNTVVLSLTVHAWRNKGKADMEKVDTEADKSRLSITKKLIDSAEYRAIRKADSDTKDWVKYHSVPSFFRDGLWLVKNDTIDEVDTYLKKAVGIQRQRVDGLLAVYPEQKEKARAVLKNMFNDADYPTAAELQAAFGIDWHWIQLGVAENLPSDIRKKENAKLEKLWEEAIGEIIMGLRTGFKELVDHAVERLSVAPGEKPKVFKDTFVPNFMMFVDTFAARNVVDDKELSALVEQARKLLEGVNSDDLRTDVKLRDYTAEKFQKLQKAVDEAVVTAGRKFDFTV